MQIFVNLMPRENKICGLSMITPMKFVYVIQMYTGYTFFFCYFCFKTLTVGSFHRTNTLKQFKHVPTIYILNK